MAIAALLGTCYRHDANALLRRNDCSTGWRIGDEGDYEDHGDDHYVYCRGNAGGRHYGIISVAAWSLMLADKSKLLRQ